MISFKVNSIEVNSIKIYDENYYSNVEIQQIYSIVSVFLNKLMCCEFSEAR